MFESIIEQLSSLIEPIDFVGETSTKKILNKTSEAIVQEINAVSDVQAHLLDILIRDEVQGGICLTPLIDGNNYEKLFSGRPPAKSTFVHLGGVPRPDERGVWSWAYAYDKRINLWVNDIQKSSYIRSNTARGREFGLLEPGYLMVDQELENKLDKRKRLPSDLIIFGSTSSIIVIPLTHKKGGERTYVGLLSIEAKKGNFTEEIYSSLLRLSKWIASLLWRFDTSIHMKKDTNNAINRYTEKIFERTKTVQKDFHFPNNFRSNPYFEWENREQYRNDIFVVMPLSQQFKGIYENNLVNLGKQLNLTISRSKDYFSNNISTKDIFSNIYYSRYIIIDCTGRDPNVFYILGNAHTLHGKQIIIISQNEDDIPFDFSSITYIHYDNTREGLAKLFKALLEKIR